MREGWKYGVLDDAVTKASSNISLNKIQNEIGEYPVFGAQGLVKRVSFFQRKEEYLAIIKDGAGIGRVSKHPAESSVLATMQYLIPKKDFDIDFIKYYLESLDFEDYRTGSTIPHIYYKDYKNAKFPFVNSTEQKQIVAILDEAFAAIDQAKANIEKNRLNAKELFQSKLNQIFNQKRNDWEIKPLGDLATFRNGMNFSKKGKGAKIKIVGVRDFQDSFYVPNETLSNVTLDGDINDFDLLKDGDIVTVRSNGNPQLIGRTLLAKNIDEKVCHSGFTIRIRLTSNKIEPEYLCQFLKIQETRKKLVESGNGVGIKSLNQGSLSCLLIPFPKSTEEQIKIKTNLDYFSEETNKLEAIYQNKLNDLNDLKKSILQKAFAGELTSTVSDSSFTDKTESLSSHLFEKIDGISPTDLQAGLTAIALNKHLESETAHTFHHVKAEKIIHLAEYALGIDLERNPVKDAAGPNDFKHSKKIESRAKKAGFYTVTKHGDVYEYSLGTQAQKLIDKATTALGNRFSEFNKLLELFVPMNTQQAEIVATVYAAWNNLLIQGKPTTDEAIVLEARENWHKNKLKIERDKFFNAIDWMRKYEILIPKGNGKLVFAK